MISIEKDILWLVIPVAVLVSLFLFILFKEVWSKVDINGKKY